MLTACGRRHAETGAGTLPLSCDGAPLLCARRYDEVAYATTHNAMSNAEEGWYVPCQEYGITHQLQDGVRALMLDLHDLDGQVSLCHGSCTLGSEPLLEGLEEIRLFLESDPGAVITLIFESYVDASAVEAVFTEAGLISSLHTQDPAEPWPTLGQMREAGTPLVVFSDHDAGNPAWYQDVWQYAWETPFSAETPEDLSCQRNRGEDGNPLFILNHFLTAPVSLPSLAEQVNYNPFFIERAQECQATANRLPNFVTVDFYATGDLFAVLDTLNNL